MKSVFRAAKRAIKEISGSWPHATKSYSQEGEDLVLNRVFGGRQHGFYVEVGCHHPFRFSNTYLFYRMGWSGICIDPLPGTAALFKKWRSRDICIESGISSRRSTLNYFMFNEPALNTFDESVAKSRDGLLGYRIIECRKIETIPLGDAIERNIARHGSTQIDFFSIDVEGLDLQVLQSNNWEKFRPAIIIAECLDLSFKNLGQDPVVEFLSGKGYEIYAKTGESVVFKAESERVHES
jgi:FkbM family methyltransferase